MMKPILDFEGTKGGAFIVALFMDDFGNAVFPYELASYMQRYNYFTGM